MYKRAYAEEKFGGAFEAQEHEGGDVLWRELDKCGASGGTAIGGAAASRNDGVSGSTRNWFAGSRKPTLPFSARSSCTSAYVLVQ